MIPAPSSASAYAVQKVGKYRILSELGRGGMANVFLAVTQGPGAVNKLVVLKALRSELAAEPSSLAMFLDEARLAAQLNHPNVVQTYEVGTEGNRHVIVMEYLEGQALSSIIRRADASGQPMPVGMHLRIIIAVLEGLHYAHELSAYDGLPLALVHRDVSPQNVFVTYDGQVKVLDFGIAKAASSSTNTATGVVKGKISYMAPEQMIAEGVDRRADVYSVGCMLWALATGEKLWKNTPDVQIMRRVLNAEMPTPKSSNPRCDDELERIVMKALASEREQRYASALQLQEDLERYCEALGVSGRQKDVGKYVAELFATARADLRTLVERQLLLGNKTPAPASAHSPTISDVPTRLELVDAASPSGRTNGPDLTEILPRPAAARRNVLAVAFALALPAMACGVWFASQSSAARGRGPFQARNAAICAAVKIETARARAPRASLVESSSPSATTVRHEVRLESPVASSPHNASRASRPPARSKPSRAAVNCAQPFFVDRDGIKKLRPECS